MKWEDIVDMKQDGELKEKPCLRSCGDVHTPVMSCPCICSHQVATKVSEWKNKTSRFSLTTPFRPGKTNYNYGRWTNDKQLLETRTNWQFREIRQTRHRRRLIRIFVWLFTWSVGFQGSSFSIPCTTASALSLPIHVFFLSYNLYLSSFYLLCSRNRYLRLTRTEIRYQYPNMYGETLIKLHKKCWAWSKPIIECQVVRNRKESNWDE